MCGEKAPRLLHADAALGSPPHVRGKVTTAYLFGRWQGITPACAGKRSAGDMYHTILKDHPRMCGEKGMLRLKHSHKLGSPPHVRGKGLFPPFRHFANGITPACAGKRLKRSRSTVLHAAIVPLFPSVCNKPAGSDGSPAGHDAPPFLPIENAAPASPAYNLRSL